MKKNIVGIVAPYKEPNYGTVLQAYALQSILKKMGVHTEYINYTLDRAPYFRRKISNIKKTWLRFFSKKMVAKSSGIEDFSFVDSPQFQSFKANFASFVKKHLTISAKEYNPISITKCKKYQSVIVGSDQTWSKPRCGKDSLYLLDPIPLNVKRLSYAPSIGTTHVDKEYIEFLVSRLQKFEMLSCRERTNCLLLSERLKRNVEFVVDPTLLKSNNDWDKIAVPNPLSIKRYILCYILGFKKEIQEYAENISRITNIPLYYIVTRPEYQHMENTLYPSPQLFLSLIRDAAYVITDSFHGTAFSINYGTQFYCFTKRSDNDSNNDNDRLFELLKVFGLESRLLSKSDCVNLSPIDYTNVHDKLFALRKDSLDYLIRMKDAINRQER